MFLDAHGHLRPVFAFWLPVLFALGLTIADHTVLRENSNWLYAEHGLNETIQYIIAFGGFFVGLATLLSTRMEHWLRIWLALASLGCLYIGLEEISYGQQFFKWETTGFWADLNDQNETNFHNMSSWYDQKPRLVLMVGIIAGGLILPLVRRYKPNIVPPQFNIIYPSGDLKWVALLTLLTYLSKTIYKLTGFTVYDRPSEVNETYIYLFMLFYLLQLRWQLRHQPFAVRG